MNLVALAQLEVTYKASSNASLKRIGDVVAINSYTFVGKR